MWIFGYGSLMWDGWEQQFDGEKIDGAGLKGYRRAFNKKSTTNWGTEQRPCPTLGLEKDESAACTGAAFRFPESQEEDVWVYLRDREGPSFDFVEVKVMLPSGQAVRAHVAINDPSARSYIGDRSPEEIASMMGGAEGDDGRCIDYLENTRAKLRSLSIEDDAVEKLWRAVKESA